MDKQEKGSIESTASDAIRFLDPRDQARLTKYVYKVAENLVLGDTTLRNASLDPFKLAEDIRQDALTYLIRWKRVKVWTLKDLKRVAAWKVRHLVANQRTLVRRQMQHMGPDEDPVVERHYDDEVAHEEHGPSFRARVLAPTAEHVGRKPAEQWEEILAYLLKEIELFLKHETRMPPRSIAKALTLLECWWKHDDASR